jgi:hypothetical protein
MSAASSCSPTTILIVVRGSETNADACAHVSPQRSVTLGSFGDHI